MIKAKVIGTSGTEETGYPMVVLELPEKPNVGDVVEDSDGKSWSVLTAVHERDEHMDTTITISVTAA